MKKSTATPCVLSLLLVALASPAAATSYRLTKVADGNTAVPSGTGFFFDVLAPALSGNSVAFLGYSRTGYGVYLFDGGTLSRVADTSTAIPNGTGTFTIFETVLLDQGNVAFVGVGESGQRGIYLFDGSTLRRVADLNTPIPAGTGVLTAFGPPALSGGNVVFLGFGGSGQQGIYLFGGGTLARVADLNTPIPDGTGTFTGLTSPALGPPAISGGSVAFRGTRDFDQEGVYLFDGVALSRVADRNTVFPNVSGRVNDFTDPVLSDGRVAFSGSGGAGELGIYLADGGTLSLVAGRDSPIPEGVGGFGNVSEPALYEGNVAFEGGADGQDGFYLFHGGTLTRVADLTTPIPRGTGTFGEFLPLLLVPPALSGKTVAFIGGRSKPEEQGIYLGDGETLSRVADRGTAIPDALGTFDGFQSLSLSGENLAFLGFSSRFGIQSGIYLASPVAGTTLRLGLRNGDDVGAAFDLRVEVYRNGSSLAASGLTRCVRGLGRNPATSGEIDVAFEPPTAVPVEAGDTLSLKVSTRIGTNADDSRCTGIGASHGSATGVRLYYDAAGQASRFDAMIEGAKANLYLHSDGSPCSSAASALVTTRFLDETAPVATQAKCKDSGAVRFAGGNSWSEIGTWGLAP